MGYQFLLLGLALPGAALALGLGDIRVDSALHQPLAAQIELVGVTSENVAGLRAEIADAEMFQRHGLERPTVLTSTAVTVRQDKQGHTILVLRSTDAFTEPMVTFLVDLHSPSGELVREYTVFLDPQGLTPDHGAVESATAPAAQPSPVPAAGTQAPVVTTAPAVESDSRSPDRQATATTNAKPALERGAASDSAPGTYTVARRDTLARITTIAGAHSRSDRRKMMIAIFRANPAAFQTNLNKLHTGAKLHLPSMSELAKISTDEANHEFAAQMAAWRAPSHHLASAPAAPSVASASRATASHGTTTATPATATTSATPTVATAAAAAAAAKSPAASTPAADTQSDLEAREAETKALTQRIALLEKSLHDLQEDLKAPPAEQAAPPTVPTAAHPARTEPTDQAQPDVDEPAPVPHRIFRFAPIAVSLGLALVAGIWLYRRRRTDEDDGSYHRSGALTDYRAEETRDAPFEKLDMSATYVVEEAKHDVEHASASAELKSRATELPADTSGLPGDTTELPVGTTSSSEATAVIETAVMPGNRTATNIEPTVKLPRILDVETTAILALQAEVDDDTAAREFAFFNPESGNNTHDTHDTHVMLASGLDEAPKPFVERRKSPADALRQAIEREPDRNDLRLKLLEVYYQAAAQNRRAFLDAVRQLSKNDKFASPNDWSQIEDMGRAIAPDDDLFSNGKDTNKKAVA